MAEDIDGDHSKKYSLVETKRHKPCLIYRGYRYVQDKIQNRTIYWRCEDRAHCNGRAHQLIDNESLPILTIKHNHQPFLEHSITNPNRIIYSQCRQRQNFKAFYYQKNDEDDLLLSSTSSTMTSPVKLENHQNRQQHLSQHEAMIKNLHLSEVITTVAATNTHHYNGIGTNRHTIVDPIEMTKLLSNITTSNNSSSKSISTSPNMDYTSRLNQFSWEEIEGRYLPVIFRDENDGLQRYTSKMYVENTLFQSESWQRHTILARSLPPLISFPYTENELKLFRFIVQWHLASFQFKTILSSDCLIRFDDLLDFYGALRKLRDTVSSTTFNRSLPIPPPIPLGPPKHLLHPSSSSSSNNLAQSFELPTMGGNSSLKSHRHSSSGKIYPPTVHHSHSSNYLLQQNVDLLTPYSNQSSQSFNFTPITPKSNVPVLPPPPPLSTQWNENLSKKNDNIRPPLPRSMIPMNNNSQKEQAVRDKRLSISKLPHQSSDNNNNINLTRETKESGWVQINNVFVPYIVKLKLRENELEKCSTRQPAAPQLQREFYVPYEILIKCHIFSDNEFAFKKLLIKATQQDFDIFNNLISNINIFDEKVPEKTVLVSLYHVMIGLQRILYVKLLTTKQPRTQVNKYHAEVLTHKGGTLLMHGNKLVPYIVQNNRFYVPLVYAYHSLPHVLSQAKRGARAPRQYEIDYLNLLFLYFSIDSPPLTSDTLLVDAFSIKFSDLQSPIHFRTLADHHQNERNRLLNTTMRVTQTNNKQINKSQQQTTNSSSHKSNKCPPANVVVNPLIHHPSFYGVSSTSPIKQTSSSSSKSVVVNPHLLQSSTNSDLSTKKIFKQPQIKPIKYDDHILNSIVKSSDLPINEWKISIKHIFEQFLFDINYEKYIQWCQTNLLLPLIKLDDEEKKILNPNDNANDYYVYYRHLDRCIALLNDLKRGVISMKLLPSSNNEVQQQQQQTGSIKSHLAGAKKRKTTVPTTRHIQPSRQSSFDSTQSELNISLQDNGHLSSELPVNDQLTSFNARNSNIDNNSNNNNNDITTNDDDDDDLMPVVATVEEEQPLEETNQIDMNSSLLIAESNECDDGKIQLDDTLPSCSSGYESAAPLTNIDVNNAHNPSSDDDETNSIQRSREHSSSCQSEQSFLPILSNVSSNIKFDSINQITNDSSPVITNQKTYVRQRDKYGKFRARSRSPTPHNVKKKRSLDEQLSSSNTITSDQIEHHLRTLLMPTQEQRRTRTRPIKTPTRLVEEISLNNSIKTTEPDTNLFDILSPSPTTTTDTNNKTMNNEPILNHQSCTYNVTISNKPNKLGLTIKKVVQR